MRRPINEKPHSAPKPGHQNLTCLDLVIFSAETGLRIEMGQVDRLAVSKFVACPAQRLPNTYKLLPFGLLSELLYPLPLGIYTRPYSSPSCNIHYLNFHNCQPAFKLRDGFRQSRSSRS